MENRNNTCPGCSQHCDRNNLQCGKGEAYFNGESAPESGRPQGRHGSAHHGHEGKCCGRHREMGHGHCKEKHRGHPEFPAGSLADLLAKCGHRLFHGGDESMFAVLNDEETVTLKNLLSKLLAE